MLMKQPKDQPFDEPVSRRKLALSERWRTQSPPRGRPAQIATPTDIRWPVVQEFLRSSSSLSPNSRKLYDRELKRFLGWTQCRWPELQSRHLGLYKAYLMELEVTTGKKLSKNSLNSALKIGLILWWHTKPKHLNHSVERT